MAFSALYVGQIVLVGGVPLVALVIVISLQPPVLKLQVLL